MASLAKTISSSSWSGEPRQEVVLRSCNTTGYGELGKQFGEASTHLQENFQAVADRLRQTARNYTQEEHDSSDARVGRKIAELDRARHEGGASSASLWDVMPSHERLDDYAERIAHDWQTLNNQEIVRQFKELGNKAIRQAEDKLKAKPDANKQAALDGSKEIIKEVSQALDRRVIMLREGLKSEVEDILAAHGLGREPQR